jgi:hypothetical protein
VSRTPDHYECPSGSIRSWRREPFIGRQEVAYVRETELVENPLRAYRHTEAKRKWVRIGVVCMDCGFLQRDRALPRPPAGGIPVGAPDGLPKSAIATDGIPTGSGG